MMLRTLLVFVCWSVGSALTGHVVSCRHRSTLTLPHNKRYDWDLPKGSDGDLVTDLLVEMGASTAVIVPLEQETSFLETNALCLGAVQACAVDVSEDALDITQKNLQHNKHLFDQHHKVQVVYGADYDSRHESFDVVIANIPSTTLMTVLPTLVSSMKRKILLAGYPSSEARLVSQEADKLGLIERPERRVYDCGWILQEFEASTSC